MSVTTGKVRLSYCHVWQPQVPQSGGEAKYSVTILIPKSDVNTLNAFYAEMEATKQAGVSASWGGTLPPVVKIPLYDGDGVRPSGESFGEECRGHMVITAASKTQPGIVDLNVQPILNQSEVYSGCYARVSINFFSYNQAGNKGLGCGLNCIQKVAEGEPLSGGVSAQDAFGGSNSFPSAAPGMPVLQAPVYPPQQQPVYQAPQGAAMGGMMPAVPGAAAYGYQAGALPQMPYQQPFNQGIDPITGRPLVGGIMGL